LGKKKGNYSTYIILTSPWTCNLKKEAAAFDDTRENRPNSWERYLKD